MSDKIYKTICSVLWLQYWFTESSLDTFTHIFQGCLIGIDLTKWLTPHQWWNLEAYHDDVIKWKHFPRYWPFVRGIHRSPVNSPNKGQWRGALMFSLICARINGWVNNGEAGDLRRHRSHNDVIVMLFKTPATKTPQTQQRVNPVTLHTFCGCTAWNISHVPRVKVVDIQMVSWLWRFDFRWPLPTLSWTPSQL